MGYREMWKRRLKERASRLNSLLSHQNAAEELDWLIQNEIRMIYEAGLALYGSNMGETFFKSWEQDMRQVCGYCITCTGDPNPISPNNKCLCEECIAQGQELMEDAENLSEDVKDEIDSIVDDIFKEKKAEG